jgi:hypothetical protein
VRSLGEFKRKFLGFLEMVFKQEDRSEDWLEKKGKVRGLQSVSFLLNRAISLVRVARNVRECHKSEDSRLFPGNAVPGALFLTCGKEFS